jgi:hypothetical protein
MARPPAARVAGSTEPAMLAEAPSSGLSFIHGGAHDLPSNTRDRHSVLITTLGSWSARTSR